MKITIHGFLLILGFVLLGIGCHGCDHRPQFKVPNDFESWSVETQQSFLKDFRVKLDKWELKPKQNRLIYELSAVCGIGIIVLMLIIFNKEYL